MWSRPGPRTQAQFADSPFELQRGAPLLGEHSREVLEDAVRTSLLSLQPQLLHCERRCIHEAVQGLSVAAVDELFADGITVTVEPRKADPSRTRLNKLRVSSG